MDRILVLYGTTEGHTSKIARAIGATLEAHGFHAEVVEAGTFDPSPRNYSGVVVAGSIHGGSYQKAVGQWVRAHAGEMASKPTAFVTVCLAVLNRDPKAAGDLDAMVTRFLDRVKWHPTVTKAVAGALLYTRYNFFKRWIMKRILTSHGGDTDTSRDYEYTDWNDVRAFAIEFGRRVRGAAAA